MLGKKRAVIYDILYDRFSMAEFFDQAEKRQLENYYKGMVVMAYELRAINLEQYKSLGYHLETVFK